MTTRRRFLETGLKGGLAVPLLGLPRFAAAGDEASLPVPLAERFPDLRRHVAFEYYPWYGADPFRHWNEGDRVPPLDLASNYVPLLGAYDSRSVAVLEQHARWMADAGVGSVNLSWWGPGSYEDRAVPLAMDVFADHDLKVAFTVEPYADGPHGASFAADVRYLIETYGEQRKYDALLLLPDAAGRAGPVFKGFRMILPEVETDCHGVTAPVPDFTPDAMWRQQIDRVREENRGRFHHVTVLADTVNTERARAAGFDGIAPYDVFVGPEAYPPLAEAATLAGLVFSFNVNAGFDSMVLRSVPPESCYQPPPFAPPAPPFDPASAEGREMAARLAEGRIRVSLAQSLAVQIDPALRNAQAGFFLTYVTTFNEWHEGTSFEPMRNAALLDPAQGALGYHNPEDGGYRLAALRELLRGVLNPGSAR